MSRQLIVAQEGEPLSLPAMAGRPACPHVFDQRSVDALNMALATGRPLLVRGEPGVGKSQLARAAAVALERAFVATVLDAHVEPRDLRYRIDLIRRLAQAQIVAHAANGDVDLSEANFLTPGPLWWALDWGSALVQAQASASASGTVAEVPWKPDSWERLQLDGDFRPAAVVLIDEIDKADPSVPNGLLEVLGDARFGAPGRSKPITKTTDPLVVVTTNEERRLPQAFLRRCLVLTLQPDKDFAGWLISRGRRHYPGLNPDVYEKAAAMLISDRTELAQRGFKPPGLAEYIDLLKALHELTATEPEGSRHARQDQLVERLRDYVFWKHPVGRSHIEDGGA